MSDELITWLRAQLDEDERLAREASRGSAGASWAAGTDGLAMPFITGAKSSSGWLHSVASPEEPEYGPHIARHDPARVLAEVDAKRRIIAKHELWSDAKYPDSDGGYASALDDVLVLLALSYVDRPGYRSEWAP